MTKELDPVKFNTDPAFDAERAKFDALTEGSLLRLKAKHAKDNPEPDNFFDSLFGSIFGEKK